MTNNMIVRYVSGLRDARSGWVEAAVQRDSLVAAQHIVSINSKIELLLGMWNWSDESVDYPHGS